MIASLLAALALAAGSDPCAPPDPLPQPDPAAARLYREVGDAERAAGAREPALAAYREALRRDSRNDAVRTAFDALCRDESHRGDPFLEGLSLMQKGDARGAIVRFKEARAVRRDPSTALLEGICQYSVGDDRAAAPLLREAEAAPAHRDVARYYLGLAALRQGSAPEAAALFESAAVNPNLERLASDLARLAHRDGKLVLSVLGESGWDSNVSLTPGGGLGLATAADGTWGATAAALYRPLGQAGPYLRASGFLHQQFQLGAYDLGGLDGAAGWQLGQDGRAALAEYDFGYRTFGGSSFLSFHRLLASGWTTAAGVTWGATYVARIESYADGWSAFTGLLQRGEVRATFPLGGRTLAGLAYGAGHDSTRQSVLDFTEHGPSALLRFTAAARLRVGLDAGFTWRTYGAFDPVLSARRDDTYLDGSAFAEFDLSNHFVARLSLAGRKAFSNVPAFDYAKLAPTVGLAWIGGL